MAIANAVVVGPPSLLAFCIVTFWALVIAAGVVALRLAFLGGEAFRVFVFHLKLNGVALPFLPAQECGIASGVAASGFLRPCSQPP